MNINVLLWRRTTCVLAEEMPGKVKRLTGDQFGEDGVMPLMCAVLGKEVYIGCAATCIGYEYPRAKLIAFDTVLQSAQTDTGVVNVDAVSAIALFLRSLDEAIRRRHLHDAVHYRFFVDDTYGAAQVNVLALACWSIGIADACVAGMAKLPLSIEILDKEAAMQSALLCAVQNSVPWAGLGGGSNGQWSVIDCTVADFAVDDPVNVCANGQLAAADMIFPGRMRSPALIESLARGLLADRLLPKEEFGNTVVATEIGYWRALASSAVTYKDRMGDTAADKLIAVESGQRHFAARFEKLGKSILQSTTGMTTECALLESIQWSKARSINGLDAAIVLALLGDDGFVVDSKLVTPKDAELPFESSHIVYLSKASQLSLRIQLNQVDELTGDLYSFASIPVRLAKEMKRNTAVHLTVRCLVCGVLELVVEIPEYHFSELVVLDTEGTPVPFAVSVARDVRVNYYV